MKTTTRKQSVSFLLTEMMNKRSVFRQPRISTGLSCGVNCRKQLFIDSILRGYATPALCFLKIDGEKFADY